jgi:hypoxanthine phosphoribosyltransferase
MIISALEQANRLHPLITGPELQSRISMLAAEIDAGIALGATVEVLCVMKGAFFFGADLCRRLTNMVRMNFVQASSYVGTQSSGAAEFIGDLSFATGQTVLVLEDIIDTGNTLSALLTEIRRRNPDRLELAALLHKDSDRTREAIRNLNVDKLYLGFRIPDQFVVGYGLDYNQMYRQLDGIYLLK